MFKFYYLSMNATDDSVSKNMMMARDKKEEMKNHYGDLFDLQRRVEFQGCDTLGRITPLGVEAETIRCLMESYRVFDKTAEMYLAIIERVKLYNPEWLESFKLDHERKLRVCKVPVYIGTQ